MKRIGTLAVILCLLGAGKLYADEQSSRKLAGDLLVTMKVNEQVDATYDQMKAIQKDQMKGMGAPQESMNYQDKMMDLMAQEMSWEKLKEDYITVYSQVFTEEELKGLIDFYKSPLGQKFVEKMPALTTKLMQVGQKHSAALMPKIKAMSSEMTGEMMKKSQPPAASPEAAPALNAVTK